MDAAVPMSKTEQMSSMKGAMEGGKWELESVSIRPAENGFTVSCSKRKTGKKGMSDYRTKDYVFETADAAMDHIKSLLAGEDPKGDYEGEED